VDPRTGFRGTADAESPAVLDKCDQPVLE